MEIIAKVISRLEKQSGTSASSGKEWQKQQYIVQYDYDRQYPHTVVMTFFGDKVAEAASILHKDTIARFIFDINSREVETSKGKVWFGSNDCYSVSLYEQTQQAQPTTVYPQAAPEPQPAPATNSNTDDLPF